MTLRESERLELKREVCEGIVRSVVAFANSDGGRAVVGVDDFGEVVGVEDPDDVMLRIGSMLRDGICPEITHFVSIRSEVIDGKSVVCVDVERGDNRPYCLARKGFCPQGVFVRFGPGNSPVSWGEIRRMIREADGDSFELRRSGRQDLTFLSARRAFEANGRTFEESAYPSLRVVDGSGYYTNLALLLSDQCPYSVRCAVIDDTGREYQFLNRQECTGSVFEQLERAALFLDAANRLRSSVEGYVRVDAREYPERAVRETLLNCIVHRDYESNAATLVKVFSDRMTFVSGGGLPEGLTCNLMMRGMSVPRNPHLARIFQRLGLVEGWGSGVPFVVDAYASFGLAPTYEPSSTALFVTLPNLNTYDPQRRLRLVGDPGPDGESQSGEGLGPITIEHLGTARLGGGMVREDWLLRFAREHGEFTRDEAQRELGLGRDATLKVINSLIEQGKLEKEGLTRAVRYRAVG